MMNEGTSFIRALDNFIYINGEVIPDKCEDAYCVKIDNSCGVVAVMDGCGGLGGTKYAAYDENKGAYVASRAVGFAVEKWFDDVAVKNRSIDDEALLSQLKSYIDRCLSSVDKYAAAPITIKGGMIRPFPTTLSLVLLDTSENYIRARFIWAGDSRGYLLNAANGLMQVTLDDVRGNADAMENLTEDSPLSNVISSDKNYRLNIKTVYIDTPFMAITSTDGCFGYLKSPMEFEFILLTSLLDSDSMRQWESKLREALKSHASDDYTIIAAVFNYGDFDSLKRSFGSRCNLLYQKYISPSNEPNADIHALWNDYKATYIRFIKS